MAIYPSKTSVFLLGFAIGVIFAFVITVSKSKIESPKPSIFRFNVINRDVEENPYDHWLANSGYAKYPVNYDYFSYSGNKSLSRLLEYQLLRSKINLLCVMFIRNVNNAYSAVNTWMKHCNSYKFYSMKPEKYLDVTVMRPKSSWHYLCEVIRHIDSNSDNYMWVLFVPDDVFAIPENLRHYVFGKNSEEHYYFGHSAFFWNEHFNLAQAGYVLSKGSLKALVNKFPSKESCKISGKYWKNEDYYLGKYLSELGVRPLDTRDHLGRGRFHLFTPAQLMAPGDVELLSKYWKSSLYPITQGKNCCSPQSITFQGTNEAHMYFYHYLLYSLHVHRESGMGALGNNKSRVFTPSEQIWQQFVLDELGPHVNLSAITFDKFYDLWKDKIDSPSNFNKRLRALFLGESDD